jgi:hypothetical protein
MDFVSYSVIDETEKALKIKVPYWEKSSRGAQKYAILWMPKSVTNATAYVVDKLNAKGLTEYVLGLV